MTAISPENSTGQVHDLDGDEQEHNADEFVDNEFASGETIIGTNENGSKGSSTRKPFDVGFRKRVKPTYFSDKHGNLKAVNTVIRHPFKIFLFLIVLCLVLSFLLSLLVFCIAENNNPFTPPSNEFDLNDVRSIQYDSLRLARDEVVGGRKAVSKEGQTVEKQSELAAIAYWVFESETPKGLFSSVDSIQAMVIFSTKTKALKTTANLTTAHLSPMELIANAVRHLPHCSCTYHSSWDSEKVAAVIEELKVPGNAKMFNSLALTVIQGLYCELVPDVTVQDKMWAGMLGKNIKDHQSNSKGFKKWLSSQLKFKKINNLQFAIQLIR